MYLLPNVGRRIIQGKLALKILTNIDKTERLASKKYRLKSYILLFLFLLK